MQQDLTSLPSPFLHTVSDQKLEPGTGLPREQRGPGEKLSLVKRAKIFQLIIHYRRGQPINSIGSACLHMSKYTNHESVTDYY